MNQSTGTANWIGAYLEWTDAGSFIGAREHNQFSGAEAAGADPAEEYTAAYLEWIDAAPPVRYHWDAKPMSTVARVDIEMNWPHALEDVAAHVR